MTGAILNVVFLETNKGGRQFIWNCYTYRQNNKRDTWISWKCVGNVHNNLPDGTAVEARKILSAI